MFFKTQTEGPWTEKSVSFRHWQGRCNQKNGILRLLSPRSNQALDMFIYSWHLHHCRCMYIQKNWLNHLTGHEWRSFYSLSQPTCVKDSYPVLFTSHLNGLRSYGWSSFQWGFSSSFQTHKWVPSWQLHNTYVLPNY